MTTTTLPMAPVKIALPTREELRALMNTPAVVITMIICGTLLAFAAMAGVVFLAYTGNDTAVIGTLIIGVLTAVGVMLNNRVKKTLDAVNQQQPKE